VAETPDKETQQPKALERAWSRVPAMLASLAALAVIGALSISGYALTDLKIFEERSPLHEAASVLIPDPAVSATLRDVQLLQQQNAAALHQNGAVLERLVASSNAQQADLTRISDRLSWLAARVDALQNAATPLTTSTISKPTARVPGVGPSRKKSSQMPKAFGPVSVGGAPLRLAPVRGFSRNG
jgi:uncharacterized protein HemX